MKNRTKAHHFVALGALLFVFLVFFLQYLLRKRHILLVSDSVAGINIALRLPLALATFRLALLLGVKF